MMFFYLKTYRLVDIIFFDLYNSRELFVGKILFSVLINIYFALQSNQSRSSTKMELDGANKGIAFIGKKFLANQGTNY